MLGIIDDFADRRATVRRNEKSVLDVALVLIPTIIATVIPFYGPLANLWAGIPLVTRIIRFIIPWVLVLISIRIISNSIKEKHRGLTPERDEEATIYRYSQSSRLTAKLLLIPLLFLAITQTYLALPNGLLHDSALSGYLCTIATGDAATGIAVNALDIEGEIISKTEESTDDTGYFSLSLDWWAQRPRYLSISSERCNSEKHQVTVSARTRTGCPAAKIEPPPRQDKPYWRTRC